MLAPFREYSKNILKISDPAKTSYNLPIHVRTDSLFTQIESDFEEISIDVALNNPDTSLTLFGHYNKTFLSGSNARINIEKNFRDLSINTRQKAEISIENSTFQKFEMFNDSPNNDILIEITNSDFKKFHSLTFFQGKISLKNVSFLNLTCSLL